MGSRLGTNYQGQKNLVRITMDYGDVVVGERVEMIMIGGATYTEAIVVFRFNKVPAQRWIILFQVKVRKGASQIKFEKSSKRHP